MLNKKKEELNINSAYPLFNNIPHEGNHYINILLSYLLYYATINDCTNLFSTMQTTHRIDQLPILEY